MRWEIPEQAKIDWKNRVEEIDAMPEVEVEKRAKSILMRVGLELTDLKDKAILDIGSGPCMIEKAVKGYIGKGHVVSLDDKPYALSQKEELGGRVVGDALDLPLDDESFDLIISTGDAPPFLGSFGEEEETLRAIQEMKRVLRRDGQIRISAGAFGFIEKAWERPQHLRGPWNTLSEDAKEERRRLTREHTEQSFQYLEDQGYNIELVKIERGKFQVEYWLIKN